MLKKVGNKIRQIREAKGLTQANMGEELGMNGPSFSKIELGKVNIPLKRLFQIAEILEVPVTTFFDENLSFAKENKTQYGYASKSEVENLSHLVQKLIKEVEKLRSEISSHPRPKKKSKK